MIYLIVTLLAFCAITAYATPVPEDNFNPILNTIEEIVVEGEKFYNKSVNQLFNQLKYVEEQLKILADNAKNKVIKLFYEAEEKYHKLKKLDEHGKYCIQKYVPKYENVFTVTQEDYRVCGVGIIANGRNLRKELEKQLDEMKKKIDEISQKVKDCISFILNTFRKCIFRKRNKLSVGFKDIKKLSQDVFQSGVNGGAELVKFVTQCEASAYNKFHKNFTDVVNSFVDCVQNPVEKKTEKPVEAETEKSAEKT